MRGPMSMNTGMPMRSITTRAGVAMYAPSLSLDDGTAGQTGASPVLFTPRPGLLMLFPAWLSHQVRPYLGRSQRISIAFNLRADGRA